MTVAAKLENHWNSGRYDSKQSIYSLPCVKGIFNNCINVIWYSRPLTTSLPRWPKSIITVFYDWAAAMETFGMHRLDFTAHVLSPKDMMRYDTVSSPLALSQGSQSSSLYSSSQPIIKSEAIVPVQILSITWPTSCSSHSASLFFPQFNFYLCLDWLPVPDLPQWDMLMNVNTSNPARLKS